MQPLIPRLNSLPWGSWGRPRPKFQGRSTQLHCRSRRPYPLGYGPEELRAGAPGVPGCRACKSSFHQKNNPWFDGSTSKPSGNWLMRRSPAALRLTVTFGMNAPRTRLSEQEGRMHVCKEDDPREPRSQARAGCMLGTPEEEAMMGNRMLAAGGDRLHGADRRPGRGPAEGSLAPSGPGPGAANSPATSTKCSSAGWSGSSSSRAGRPISWTREPSGARPTTP